ncbi:MAG: hypothetical protein KQJ78_14510 [Deltaproteobacteria bacterium]|nr:hypothetical protein [Deltaproteobacteria bacterium]
MSKRINQAAAPRLLPLAILGLALIAGLTVWGLSPALADLPGRPSPANHAVPNPGTQSQELTNITLPAEFNVFEFVVTCAGCHGGGIMQQAGHFAVWSGSSMANAARDPIFRANQQIVNDALKTEIGDGGGNICIRCHSPNAWFSGRTDPFLNGTGDASGLIHSLVLSTDDEGVLCEFCHRTQGSVTMKRADLNAADPVWKMLAGLYDWPHAGLDYPQGPLAGNPYGDSTFQVNDAMSYGGKYAGITHPYFSDDNATGGFGGTYTGQIFGVDATTGLPVYAADGSLTMVNEVPIGPPEDLGGNPIYENQAVSPEHSTWGGGTVGFMTTPEFCGSCHDLTIPVTNHGMPEQRTYTEWKYSAYSNTVGPDYQRCQDCHMPTMKHEWDDNARVSLNPDPTLAGWFPYAKDRNAFGGTTFHKLSGSNRDLQDMLKLLYPEVDLEPMGAPTGNDPRVFPGQLSSRDIAWDRTREYTELKIRDAVTLEIVSATVAAGRGQVQVKVTNNAGHRIPSGYPDGRRFWIQMNVFNNTNQDLVYQSGYYDQDTATLYNDGTMAGITRAQTPVIDGDSNQVMIYEKRTGMGPDGGPYAMSVSLLNHQILFDNRIPPLGYDRASYSAAGTKFYKYAGTEAAATPSEDINRYPDGQNWDLVTYNFDVPAGVTSADLRVQASLQWQTHTREFMEFLKDNNTNTYRPQGPPDILDPNYPNNPTYLSDSFATTTGTAWADMTDLAGNALRDNWGGLAYAAWLKTGKGAPWTAAKADNKLTGAPTAPTGLQVLAVTNAALGLPDPCSHLLTWNPVNGVDGYVVWMRYGADTSDPTLPASTADWDRIAVIPAGTQQYLSDALNVAKTYQYRVQAFNAVGLSGFSTEVSGLTPTDLPLPPINLVAMATTANSVTLTWADQADNETGFIIQRQDVPVTADFQTVAMIPTSNGTAVGGVNWTDTTVGASSTYNYRVTSYNASGWSTWTTPAQATTAGQPTAPVLSGNYITNYESRFSWTVSNGPVIGYKLQRSTDQLLWTSFPVFQTTQRSYADATTQPLTTYYYRVIALSSQGVDSVPSNVVTITTNLQPAPSQALLMYRLYNPNNQSHFFTTSAAEAWNAVNAGLSDEFTGNNWLFCLWMNQVNGTRPVFRLYNPNDGHHYLTLRGAEKDALLNLGWTLEKITGYLYPATQPYTREIFTFYVPATGNHLYTMNPNEAAFIIANLPSWLQANSLGWGYRNTELQMNPQPAPRALMATK